MQQHPTTPLPRSTPLYNTERERDSIEESCNLPSSQFTPHPRKRAYLLPPFLPPRRHGKKDGETERLPGFRSPSRPLAQRQTTRSVSAARTERESCSRSETERWHGELCHPSCTLSGHMLLVESFGQADLVRCTAKTSTSRRRVDHRKFQRKDLQSLVSR